MTIPVVAGLAGNAWAQTEPPPPAPEVVLAPEPPPPPKKKGLPVSVSYDGGTTFNSDDGTFQLKINGNLQTRFEWNYTETPDTGITPATGGTARFILTRARLAMTGYVFKDTSFKFEYAFSDQGNQRLRDFYVTQSLADGWLQIRAGQYKRPFNRQEIESDFTTEFVEKANTLQWPGAEGGVRDLGFGISNGIERSPDGVEYSVNLFNGQGETSTIPSTCTVAMATGAVTCVNGTPTNTPRDWQPMLVARLGYNYGGIRGYSEGDLEGGGFRFAGAVSYRAKNIQDTATLPLEHDFEADIMAKFEGADLSSTFFIRKQKNIDQQYAFHVQAGYFIIPRTIQVVARFAEISDAVPMAGADQTYDREYRIGFNWYMSHNHYWKWVNDFGYLKDSAAGSPYRLNVRIGCQLVF